MEDTTQQDGATASDASQTGATGTADETNTSTSSETSTETETKPEGDTAGSDASQTGTEGTDTTAAEDGEAKMDSEAAGEGDTETEIVDQTQTTSGGDVNALRNSIDEGSSLEITIEETHQNADGSYTVVAATPDLVAHHSDNVTVQTEGWVPAQGDICRLERQVPDVEPSTLFAYKVEPVA